MLTGLASPVGQGALELNVTRYKLKQAPYQIQSDQHANTMTIEILFPISRRAGAGGGSRRRREPLARPLAGPHKQQYSVCTSTRSWSCTIASTVANRYSLRLVEQPGSAMARSGGAGAPSARRRPPSRASPAPGGPGSHKIASLRARSASRVASSRGGGGADEPSSLETTPWRTAHSRASSETR